MQPATRKSATERLFPTKQPVTCNLYHDNHQETSHISSGDLADDSAFSSGSSSSPTSCWSPVVSSKEHHHHLVAPVHSQAYHQHHLDRSHHNNNDRPRRFIDKKHTSHFGDKNNDANEDNNQKKKDNWSLESQLRWLISDSPVFGGASHNVNINEPCFLGGERTFASFYCCLPLVQATSGGHGLESSKRLSRPCCSPSSVISSFKSSSSHANQSHKNNCIGDNGLVDCCVVGASVKEDDASLDGCRDTFVQSSSSSITANNIYDNTITSGEQMVTCCTIVGIIIEQQRTQQQKQRQQQQQQQQKQQQRQVSTQARENQSIMTAKADIISNLLMLLHRRSQTDAAHLKSQGHHYITAYDKLVIDSGTSSSAAPSETLSTQQQLPEQQQHQQLSGQPHDKQSQPQPPLAECPMSIKCCAHCSHLLKCHLDSSGKLLEPYHGGRLKSSSTFNGQPNQSHCCSSKMIKKKLKEGHTVIHCSQMAATLYQRVDNNSLVADGGPSMLHDRNTPATGEQVNKESNVIIVVSLAAQAANLNGGARLFGKTLLIICSNCVKLSIRKQQQRQRQLTDQQRTEEAIRSMVSLPDHQQHHQQQHLKVCESGANNDNETTTSLSASSSELLLLQLLLSDSSNDDDNHCYYSSTKSNNGAACCCKEQQQQQQVYDDNGLYVVNAAAATATVAVSDDGADEARHHLNGHHHRQRNWASMTTTRQQVNFKEKKLQLPLMQPAQDNSNNDYEDDDDDDDNDDDDDDDGDDDDYDIEDWPLRGAHCLLCNVVVAVPISVSQFMQQQQQQQHQHQPLWLTSFNESATHNVTDRQFQIVSDEKQSISIAPDSSNGGAILPAPIRLMHNVSRCMNMTAKIDSGADSFMRNSLGGQQVQQESCNNNNSNTNNSRYLIDRVCTTKQQQVRDDVFQKQCSDRDVIMGYGNNTNTNTSTSTIISASTTNSNNNNKWIKQSPMPRDNSNQHRQIQNAVIIERPVVSTLNDDDDDHHDDGDGDDDGAHYCSLEQFNTNSSLGFIYNNNKNNNNNCTHSHCHLCQRHSYEAKWSQETRNRDDNGNVGSGDIRSSGSHDITNAIDRVNGTTASENDCNLLLLQHQSPVITTTTTTTTTTTNGTYHDRSTIDSSVSCNNANNNKGMSQQPSGNNHSSVVPVAPKRRQQHVDAPIGHQKQLPVAPSRGQKTKKQQYPLIRPINNVTPVDLKNRLLFSLAPSDSDHDDYVNLGEMCQQQQQIANYFASLGANVQQPPFHCNDLINGENNNHNNSSNSNNNNSTIDNHDNMHQIGTTCSSRHRAYSCVNAQAQLGNTYNNKSCSSLTNLAQSDRQKHHSLLIQAKHNNNNNNNNNRLALNLNCSGSSRKVAYQEAEKCDKNQDDDVPVSHNVVIGNLEEYSGANLSPLDDHQCSIVEKNARIIKWLHGCKLATLE